MKDTTTVQLLVSKRGFDQRTGQPISGIETIDFTPSDASRTDVTALKLVASASDSEEATQSAKSIADILGFRGALKSGYYDRPGQSGDFWVTVAKGQRRGTSLEDVEAMLAEK